MAHGFIFPNQAQAGGAGWAGGRGRAPSLGFPICEMGWCSDKVRPDQSLERKKGQPGAEYHPHLIRGAACMRPQGPLSFLPGSRRNSFKRILRGLQLRGLGFCAWSPREGTGGAEGP